MKNRILTSLLLSVVIVLIINCNAMAQPAEKLIKIAVAPDHPDWIYRVGEKVKFQVSVTRNNVPVATKVYYEVAPEKMQIVKSNWLELKDGKCIVDGATMQTPGFLRCRVIAVVDGVAYEGLATAGFEPTNIEPTTQLPNDFEQFWDSAKVQLSRVPIDAKLTLLPDRCTDKVNVYQANIQNFKAGSRLYGILCVPKNEGKYPALLRLPGAGVRPYSGDIAMAENGIITFEIGIHGIPVTLDAAIYNDLGKTTIDGYPFYNLDDRDRYYYKRVYVGCLRAIDFLATLPQYDGETLAVTGGSQGGALSIVTAALDPRVKYLAALYPALCDLTGYLYNRAGGWPHLFTDKNKTAENNDDKIQTSKYYDVVNFARFVKIPGFYSWGFNDVTCPPTSMYAAYNVITAPKELYIFQDTGHWTYSEQSEQLKKWLQAKLLGKKS